MHRKVVSVLFCDVVGSTALGESTDSEALQAVLAEAAEWVERARATAADTDAESQVSLRRAQARLLARRRDHEGAKAVAQEALALADGTDDPALKAEARVALAEVFEVAGKQDEAVGALEQALELFERKEHVLGAAEARRRLAGLRAVSPS